MNYFRDSLTLTTSSRGDSVDFQLQGEFTDIKGTTTHAIANKLYVHLLRSPKLMATCSKLEMSLHVSSEQDSV